VAGGDDLRAVMRRFPAGVCVVTLDRAGERLGITVGSLTSLSLEPPLVGLTIGRDLSAHELLRAAGGFSVSILAGDQAELAQHFARGVPPIALWSGIDVRDGTRGPLLAGALGWLECALTAEHETGDHTLFVGEVERTELGAEGDGLVYRNGEYLPA